jgi:hypothetical protein
MSYWVATEILLTPSPKQRVSVLSRFIEVAKARDLHTLSLFLSICLSIFISYSCGLVVVTSSL